MRISHLMQIVLILVPLWGHGAKPYSAPSKNETVETCAEFLGSEDASLFLRILEHGLTEKLIPPREVLRVAQSPTPTAPEVFNGSPEEYSALKEALSESLPTHDATGKVWAEIQTALHGFIKTFNQQSSELAIAKADTRLIPAPSITKVIDLKKIQGVFYKSAATLTKSGQVFWATFDGRDGVTVGLDDTFKAVAPDSKAHEFDPVTIKVLSTQQNRLIVGLHISQPSKRTVQVKIFELKDNQVKQIISYSTKKSKEDRFEIFENQDGSVSAMIDYAIPGISHYPSANFMLLKGVQPALYRAAILRENKGKSPTVKQIWSRGSYPKVLKLRSKTLLTYLSFFTNNIVVYDPLLKKKIFQTKNDLYPNVVALTDEKGEDWVAVRAADFKIHLLNLTKNTQQTFATDTLRDDKPIKTMPLQLIQGEGTNPSVIVGSIPHSKLYRLNESEKISEPTIINTLPGFMMFSTNLEYPFTSVTTELFGRLYIQNQYEGIYVTDSQWNLVAKINLDKVGNNSQRTVFSAKTSDGNIKIFAPIPDEKKFEVYQIFNDATGSQE